MTDPDSAARVLALFQPLIEATPQSFSVPAMTSADVEDIGVKIREVLKSEPTLLRLSAPCIIVGDVHGEIFDLYRVFGIHGLPPRTKYLFLGDLIDRGEESVAVVALVFALKLLFPEHVYVLRGNHEFVEMAKRQGFYSETQAKFKGSNVFGIYCDAFEYLPLAALVDETIFCVHGGISPGLKELAQIDKIQRPLNAASIDLVRGILWSDPVETVGDFVPSRRGVGYGYGQEVVRRFMEANGLELIVRGHECVAEGVKFLFESNLVSVFTASNYCGIEQNDAGVLVVEDSRNVRGSTFNREKDVQSGRAIPVVRSFRKQMFLVPARRMKTMGIVRLRTCPLSRSSNTSLVTLPKAFVCRGMCRR